MDNALGVYDAARGDGRNPALPSAIFSLQSVTKTRKFCPLIKVDSNDPPLRSTLTIKSSAVRRLTGEQSESSTQ